MKTDEKKELITHVVNTQGMQKQLQHFHEEIGELMTAISHLLRGRITKDKFTEEIVDARMMIDALVEAFQINPADYEKIDDQQWNKFKKQLEEGEIRE